MRKFFLLLFQVEDPDSKDTCCSVTSQKIISRLKQIEKIDFLGILFRIVPIIQWLPKYKWKQDFINDLMAGFTVAVMHVPQGKLYGADIWIEGQTQKERERGETERQAVGYFCMTVPWQKAFIQLQSCLTTYSKKHST